MWNRRAVVTRMADRGRKLAICCLVSLAPAAYGATAAFEAKAMEFLRNFNAGKLEAASKDFNAEMRRTVPPELLLESKREADSYAGSFKRVVSVSPRTEKNLDMLDILCEYAKADVKIVVVSDSHDRIGAVFFNPAVAGPVTPELERDARSVLARFTEGKFAEMGKGFGDDLRRQLTEARLTALRSDVEARYGAFRSIRSVRQLTDQQYRIIELTVDYETMPAIVRVVFDAGGKVAGLRINPVKPPLQ